MFQIFQCNDGKVLFCVCCCVLRKVDLVMLSMQKMKFKFTV